MKPQATGYLFAFAAFTIFACQDAISKHLGGLYSPMFIAMIRCWAFGVFALLFAARGPDGVANSIRTGRPVLQVLRGLLLAGQIVSGIMSFTHAGLAYSQAIFAGTPLFIAALSVPVLGEKVGWRRWLAIIIGMSGVLLIILPALSGVNDAALLPMLNVVMGAAYAVLTRLVNRVDTPRTSFFYTGFVGAIAMTLVGPFFWAYPTGIDWIWIAVICMTGMTSHFFLIKAYQHLDAVLVQPISYFQLVLGTLIGLLVFGETLSVNMVWGSAIVVAAGLFTVWRELARRNAAH